MSRSRIFSRLFCFGLGTALATAVLAQATPTRTNTPILATTPTRTPTTGISTPTRTPTGMVTTTTPTRTPTGVVTTPTRTPTVATTVTVTAGPGGAPTSVDQCKDGGWRNFTNPRFKNQGDCVSFVASQGRAGGNPKGSPTAVPTP